ARLVSTNARQQAKRRASTLRGSRTNVSESANSARRDSLPLRRKGRTAHARAAAPDRTGGANENGSRFAFRFSPTNPLVRSESVHEKHETTGRIGSVSCLFVLFVV